MTQERVTEDEVRTAVRAQDIAAVDAVQAVVLEADGSFTVIRASDHDATVLQGVQHASLT